MTYKIISKQDNRRVIDRVTGMYELQATLSDLRAMGYEIQAVKRVLV